MHAIFRCDASDEIGGGHVVRCLTLADALSAHNWRCTFAVRAGTSQAVPLLGQSAHKSITLVGPEGAEAEELAARAGACDLLVVDHYGRGAGFEAAARAKAGKILVIDDLADRKHDCDFLLDQTLGRQEAAYAGLVPDHARRLFGPDYGLLRPGFREKRAEALARRKVEGPVHRILISLGAGDPNGLSAGALSAIGQSGLDVVVDVAIGAASPQDLGLQEIAAEIPQTVLLHGFSADMAALMTKADLAIGAAGTSSWERCCLGLPTLMVVVADNQKEIARELERRGAAQILSLAMCFDAAALSRTLQSAASETGALRRMADAAARICDGAGAERVATALLQ